MVFGAHVREFEALEDLMGRLISFAGLTYHQHDRTGQRKVLRRRAALLTDPRQICFFSLNSTG